jgi:HNH endonuclease
MDHPSIEILRKLIAYDPDTGALTWLARTDDMFIGNAEPAGKCRVKWNGRYAGKPAFTTSDPGGYFIGSIFGRTYKAHRVIWALANGAWPTKQIDHINGNPRDNRLLNLREVSNAENGKNQKTKSNNTSGVCGVSWHKASKTWYARITVSGKTLYLGSFDNLSDARFARANSERNYNFHENHGRKINVQSV